MGVLLHSAFFLAHTGLWTISSEGGWSLLCVMRLTPLRDVSGGREEPFPVNYTFLEALPSLLKEHTKDVLMPPSTMQALTPPQSDRGATGCFPCRAGQTPPKAQGSQGTCSLDSQRHLAPHLPSQSFLPSLPPKGLLLQNCLSQGHPQANLLQECGGI